MAAAAVPPPCDEQMAAACNIVQGRCEACWLAKRQIWRVCFTCAAASRMALQVAGQNVTKPPYSNNYNWSHVDRAALNPVAAPGVPLHMPAGSALSPPSPLGPIGPVPAHGRPPKYEPPWSGFYTRMCERCECLVQSEVRQRNLPAPNFETPSVREQGIMYRYPEVTCTCTYELGGVTLNGTFQYLCFKHLKQRAFRLDNASRIADEWLRNTMLTNVVPGNPSGTTVQASQAVKNARSQDGTWRACRCGANANNGALHAPEAFWCMACHGHVAVVNWTNSRYNPANVGRFPGQAIFAQDWSTLKWLRSAHLQVPRDRR